MGCLWLIDPEKEMVYADYLRVPQEEKPDTDQDERRAMEITADDDPAMLPNSYETAFYTFEDQIPIRNGAYSCEIDFTKIRNRLAFFLP